MQNLISSLAQQFGLRADQVQAGAGAVLQLLQEKAGSGEFQQLIAKIPGAQGWIEQAMKLSQGGAGAAGGAGGGLLGAASSILGAVTGQGQTGLAGILGKLESAGFQPDSAAQFVPALLEKLKGAAGPETVEKVLGQVPGLQGLQGLGGGLLGKFIK